MRPSTRATVVWVQAAPPRGVGTPRSVRPRAKPTKVVTPPWGSASISSESRCAIRVVASSRAVAAAAAHGPANGRDQRSPPNTAARLALVTPAPLGSALYDQHQVCCEQNEVD